MHLQLHRYTKSIIIKIIIILYIDLLALIFLHITYESLIIKYFIEMRGLSTKIKEMSPKDENPENSPKKTVEKPEKWLVSITTGQHPEAGTESTLFLIAYGDRGNSNPIPLLDADQTFLSGSTCTFEVKNQLW